MTVQKIEFSGLDLFSFDKKRLTEYLDQNPHLVASYQVFPQAVQVAGLEAALVVETADLTEAQQRLLAVGIGLTIERLVLKTSS